jgi:hypothetical protein
MRGFVFPEPASQLNDAVRLTATVIPTFFGVRYEADRYGLGVVQRLPGMAIYAREGGIDHEIEHGCIRNLARKCCVRVIPAPPPGPIALRQSPLNGTFKRGH